MSTFSAPHFTDDQAAREYLEGLLWPDGPICPHCGTINHAYATKRAGVYRCAEAECRKDFTVTMRTVMERSKIALHKWLQAFHLMCASKKGISAHQLHRTLDIGYEAAWFMCHRIREAMRDGGLAPLGGGGGIVEADETYFGKQEAPKLKKPRTTPYTKKGHFKNNRAIVSLVERGGRVRSFHPAHADGESVAAIVRENIARETRLHTDESRLYVKVGAEFAAHETVNHSAKEYARGDVTTNTVEGYFSIFKRGMRGVYQHCKEKHLHRYLAEYDFRFNHRTKLGFNDGERAALAVKGAAGKRLTYRGPH
ncbi:MAG: IS1595 family transposase ISNwi1 [Pseudorhodoplanes sp.]|nr:IS1595 family transposase ISNwi1 [Pseudorhodoplanes sp.]